MRVNWNIIKMLVLLGIVVFLYAFTSGRNSERKVDEVAIEFVDNKYPFLTHENVSKLLIQNKDKTIYLKLRQNSFKVDLGKVKQLDKKFDNLKAFYQKALKDKTLNTYSKVNLQFDNQVVCTKK